MPSDSPDEAYFNDLTRQSPNERGQDEQQNATATTAERASGTNVGDGTAKTKRVACILCRRRKLKCDGVRPACGKCTRLSHECLYEDVRRKSGPKRGYVKALEARLHQVETMLKDQETSKSARDIRDRSKPPYPQHSQPTPQIPTSVPTPQFGDVDQMDSLFPPGTFSTNAQFNTMADPSAAETMAADASFTSTMDMIALGVDEALPPEEFQKELNTIFFDKIHPSLPMIHRPRFFAALDLAPPMRPPICLRYIMWCLAASVSNKYEDIKDHFYQRARKYAQADEMRGHGESTITLAHCQAWILLCTYEFKMMYFPRAWLSAGRSVRLAQMMQLHRLDGTGLDVKQCLPPPRDWTDREERRRTFWMAFCVDRYASIGTGWPMSIEEGDIKTNLPASSEAFRKSLPESTSSLEEAFGSNGISGLSSFGGVVVISAMFGRNLTHLHRPSPDDNAGDLNGAYWRRHHDMDKILLNLSLHLPDHLRIPAGLTDANSVFLNMSIHTSIICLHQAAIFKADRNRLPSHIGDQSKARCVTAADEIANLMRQICHMDLGAMNPFTAFCVYVAARVFVQFLRSKPDNLPARASLEFLLEAMHVLKRRNPLTESFLVQLEVDLDGLGLGNRIRYGSDAKLRPVSASLSGIFEKRDAYGLKSLSKYLTFASSDKDAEETAQHCAPIYELRDSSSSTSSPNCFGDNGVKIPGQQPQDHPPGMSPGPPFHTATAPVNLEIRNSPYRFGSYHEVPTSIASGPKGLPAQFVDMVGEPEMDTSADNSVDHATPSSHHASSNTSFSPPQQEDNTVFTSGATPSGSKVAPATSTATSTTAGVDLGQDFFATSGGFYPSSSSNMPGTFPLSSDWDMSGVTGPTTINSDILAGAGIQFNGDNWLIDSDQLGGLDWDGNLGNVQNSEGVAQQGNWK